MNRRGSRGARGGKEKWKFVLDWFRDSGRRKMSGPSVDVVWEPQTQMNSLDCWDYSIELSCLQGPQGTGVYFIGGRES